MNIILGSHGTGKSTLLNYLSGLNPGIYTSDGFSRPIKDSLIANKRLQQEVINTLTLWRWKEDLNKRCVFGRSIIDSIIYSKILFGGQVDVSELEKEFESTYKQVNNYFYIPIEFEIENDGVRFSDPEFQELIDAEILRFAEKYKLPLITLSGSVSERCKQLLEHI